MPEQTGPQLDWGYGTGGYGGTWLGGYQYSFKTSNGDTILPPVAALLGSGTLEGKNPYAGTAQAGWGVGGVLDGYGGPLAGTDATYDLMLAHPTVALAYASVVMPILSAGWKYEADDKRAPKGALELVQRIFSGLRTELLVQMLRAIAVGRQPFEVVWGTDDVDGATVPAWFKPLLPAWSRPLTAKGGQLIGVQQGVDLTAPGSWLWFAHDVKGTNWHGRGRLENIKRQWQNWLADDDQGYRLSQKAAGLVPYIGYPAQSETDSELTAAGKQTHQSIALGMARALQRMQPVAYQNLSKLDMESIANNAALAGKSLWDIQLLDMGDTGPAQTALTNKLAYRDKLIVRGMLRSERSVIEADTAGSRADADAHTASIADTDADVQHSLAVTTLNRQVVDAMLIENYGPTAKGTVWIEPTQIVDERRAMVNQFVAAMLGDPMLRAMAFEQIDVPALMQATDLKLNENAPPIDEIPTEGTEDPNAPPKSEDGPDSGKTVEMSREMIVLSNDDEGAGHWVTIDGTHVHIDGSGKVDKGPSDFLGKHKSELTHKIAAEHGKNRPKATTWSKLTPEERAKRIAGHTELEHFSKEDLKTKLPYSMMHQASGYAEVEDHAEQNPHDRYIIYSDGDTQKLRFRDAEDAKTRFKEEGINGYLTGPAGPEKTYFRLGLPPASGRSSNGATGNREGGVSVYLTPQSGSFGFGGDRRDWYVFKGRQVGTGGDEEPVVILTSKPVKYNKSKRD